jgi:CRISPR-associated protein Cas8a1/Csx13
MERVRARRGQPAAKVAKNANVVEAAEVTSAQAPLVLALNAPGMTPLLRAGLGGLASTLRSMALARDPRAPWPTPVKVGPGTALVERARVTLDWGGRPSDKTLRALFDGAFRLDRGVIDLPGTYPPGGPPTRSLAAAMQAGLKKTFLQHGSSTKKDGGKPVPETVDLGEMQVTTVLQRYASYVHQDAWEKVHEALAAGSVQLAGWAYPGAAQRHIAYKETKWAYDAAAALCACFAPVGCLSFEVPRSGGGGALVVVEPSDLVEFSSIRPALSPGRLGDAYVTGASDGVLSVHLSLKMLKLPRDGVAGVHGVMLRPTPWAKQQKNRTSTVSVFDVDDRVLGVYEIAAAELPTQIRAAKGKKGAEDEEDGGAGFYPLPSALRGFVTENLAHGRRWFEGFATAMTAEKKPRFIHYYRQKDNLGALLPAERKGLVKMTDRLEEAEKALVRSVHEALRRRLGAISKESKNNPATMKNRWRGERERLRLAFAGAKTHEQVRAALADLWSRAGSVTELKANWELLLPLLRPASWQAARDLALVALASYQGKGDKNDVDEQEVDEVDPDEA